MLSALMTFPLLLAPTEPLPGAPRTEPPPVSAIGLSFAFEPRVGNYPALDDDLRAYGFAPVDSLMQPTWGLRGRVRLRSGVVLGMAMTYGFRRSDHPSTPAPTTSTLVDTSMSTGYWARFGLIATVDLGFSSFIHAVGSTTEGGALVYLGPSVHPRVGWAFVGRGPMVALTVGYNLHIPVGPAHRQPVWEQPFDRPALHAFTIGVESGFGWRIGAWK